MIQIKNNKLCLDISEFGAEIKRVFHIEHKLDYMWNSDSKFWSRTAPVLFPIVGRVVKDTYIYDNKSYSLPQHGFARDMKFDVYSQTENEVWFLLTSTQETLERYPFSFKLYIGYELEEETIKVSWKIENMDDKEMAFSIGAHPAFNTNLNEGDKLSDYYLHLENNNGIETYLFDNNKGLILEEKETIIEGLNLLPLTKELFEEYPTIVLEGETGITLACYNHDHEISVSFNGFPYVGIWSPINEEGDIAPFVCIEPWFGMADTVEMPQNIQNKKGIQHLKSQDVFETCYTMTFK